MKKFKLDLKKDYNSLQNNGGSFRNPVLQAAAITLVGESSVGGVAFGQSFGRSFSKSFGRSVIVTGIEEMQ